MYKRNCFRGRDLAKVFPKVVAAGRGRVRIKENFPTTYPSLMQEHIFFKNILV